MNKVNLEERRDRKGFGFLKHANCFVPHAISSSTVIGRQLEAVTAAACSLFLTKWPSFGASDLFFFWKRCGCHASASARGKHYLKVETRGSDSHKISYSSDPCALLRLNLVLPRLSRTDVCVCVCVCMCVCAFAMPCRSHLYAVRSSHVRKNPFTSFLTL